MFLNDRLNFLPPELLEDILNHLSMKDWKTLRLTNKNISAPATSKLFRNFVLYSHENSFRRLESIANHETIRHLVIALTYDGRFLDVPLKISRQFTSVWSSQISEAEYKDLWDLASQLSSNRIKASTIIASGRQIVFLMEMFQKLPNIFEIAVHDLQENEHMQVRKDELPHFYEQMLLDTCNKHKHTSLGDVPLTVASGHGTKEHYSYIVLHSLQYLTRPLTVLKLYNVDFSHMDDTTDTKYLYGVLENSLRNLRHLTIRNSLVSEQGNVAVMYHMINLRGLLRLCSDVSELCLVLSNNQDMETEAQEPGRVLFSWLRLLMTDTLDWATSIRLVYSSRLTLLELGGLMLSGTELKHVLKPCMRTLRIMKLSGLIIVPDVDMDFKMKRTPRVCLVRLLTWIQKHFDLTEFRIKSRLSNCGMQDWVFYPDKVPNVRSQISDRDTLSRLEDYMVQGGHCPLQEFSIENDYFDFRCKSWNTPPPIADLVQSEYLNGDDRFQVSYPMPSVWPSGSEPDEDSDEEDEDEDEELETDGYGEIDSDLD